MQFQVVDEITWAAYEDKLYGADPAFVELLNDLEVQKFGSNGVRISYILSSAIGSISTYAYTMHKKDERI